MPGDEATPSSCSSAARKLHVILCEPEIAANTGAIGRTCVAAGATLWLVRPLGFHLDDRHVRRAGLDYWEHLDLRVVDHLDEAADGSGATGSGRSAPARGVLYTEAAFRPGDGLVFGPESRGLPRSWLAERPDRASRIPIRPEARSLNLANAVAIALYEAVRQIGSERLRRKSVSFDDPPEPHRTESVLSGSTESPASGERHRTGQNQWPHPAASAEPDFPTAGTCEDSLPRDARAGAGGPRRPRGHRERTW